MLNPLIHKRFFYQLALAPYFIPCFAQWLACFNYVLGISSFAQFLSLPQPKQLLIST